MEENPYGDWSEEVAAGIAAVQSEWTAEDRYQRIRGRIDRFIDRQQEHEREQGSFARRYHRKRNKKTGEARK